MTLPKRDFLVPTNPDVSRYVAAAAFSETTAGFAAVVCNAEDVGGWIGDTSGVTGERLAGKNLRGRRTLLGRFEGARTRAEETKSEKWQTPNRMERHIMPLMSMALIEISAQARRVAKGDIPPFAQTAVPSL